VGDRPIIRVQHIVKSFGTIMAVNDVSFDVRPGEIFAFLGPNGAGKTTTIKMLTTLSRPTSGSLELDGLDVTTHQTAVRKRFGVVFQDPSLDSELTAWENMDIHGVLYHVPRHARRERCEVLLRMFELWERRDDLVKTFSGGMKRRLEIARGLLHTPKVLFLDEPTRGLDPQTRRHIWDYLLELRHREGITIFMTTHYMDEAEYCDRIAIIDMGRIVALGTPDELKAGVGGDVITIATADNAAAAAEIGHRFNLTPAADNGTLRLEVSDGAAFVPRLVRELSMPVTAVTLRRPSLDDVFLKLTGRAIREEQAGALDQLRAMSARWAGRRH